ncbi:hypothetical protein [Pedobacter duraquae]|uniref:Uncharacterized protein n=1 Tax=Pedobacter duraquae TaxID=425511 RepID=A0A4R6IHP1_9SPHI|nr:hypothetical protein [Pedobacter duraquae]TDO20765.1 hypothetical protein CLV32_3399 [Pedobacter duraquae]
MDLVDFNYGTTFTRRNAVRKGEEFARKITNDLGLPNPENDTFTNVL